jgi:hypothetical protein
LNASRFIFSLLLCAASARAQTVTCAQADAEENRSQTLREEGRDLDAVRVLEGVVACERTPRRVGRLGLAEAAAGLWVPAESHLAEALRASDPWVRRVRRDLGEQLARVREHVGNLEVITNAPRGELRIGGAAVATLPMTEPLRVPSGALTYEVVAPGFERELRRVEVAAGVEQLTRENLALTPEAVTPTPPRVEPPPPQVTPPPRIAPPRDTPPPPIAPPPPRGDWMRPTAIAATAVGGLLLVGGAAALLVGAPAAEIYNDNTRCFVVGRGSRGTQCASERATAEQMGALAVAGFVSGGLLAAAGVVLFVVAPSSPRAAAVTVAPGPGDLGLSLGGRF